MRFSSRLIASLGAVFALCLTSCQMGPTLAQRLQAYIGQPEQAIVQGLGVPQRTITTGGITYLAYVWQNTQVIPGSPGPWGPWGGPWGGGGFYDPPMVVVTGCEATFQMGPSGQPGSGPPGSGPPGSGPPGGGDVAVSVILRGNGCQ